MNYQQALAYIDSYTDYEKTPVPHAAANYDLRRVDELLARLGNPHLKALSVHIAGTKGKGSTAAMIASALRVAGYTTGFYTSPHLHTIRERIRVNGHFVSEDELVALLEKVKPEVEAVNEKASYGQITTFELLTALAFTHFSNSKAEWQVLEVGLGGKYDATNVINAEFCIITSISLDHMEILGDTIADIATEKCGIIKAGSTMVSSPQADEASRVIRDTCRRMKARLIQVGEQVTGQRLGYNLNGQQLRIKGRLDSYEVSLPLLGHFQLENAATAVAMLEVLQESEVRLDGEIIIKGLEGVNWPGRFHLLRQQPVIVADGAHNPYSTNRLAESLKQYFHPEQAILVIGASSDKDIGGMARELAPFFHRVIATRSQHPRVMDAEKIAGEFTLQGKQAETAQDIPTALSLALSSVGNNDLICFTGSLFIVAEAIEAVNKLNPGN